MEKKQMHRIRLKSSLTFDIALDAIRSRVKPQEVGIAMCSIAKASMISSSAEKTPAGKATFVRNYPTQIDVVVNMYNAVGATTTVILRNVDPFTHPKQIKKELW